MLYDAKRYMMRALELAENGAGWVSPNPLVGAVIVKGGEVIGEGWHVRAGELHAERHALSRCTADPRGADLYVNLEPCCHTGRQPPCTDAIIEAGIKKVFVGSDDPNPLVAGKGIEILRNNGIEVVTGVMKDECDGINRVFFHYIRTKTPYVTMKYAMTMDGKIASHTGKSQWITGEEARRQVHETRHRCRGIMVGVGTVITDDPMLNCRIENGRDPVRIICDSKLRTPPGSRIVRSAGDIETIIATCAVPGGDQVGAGDVKGDRAVPGLPDDEFFEKVRSYEDAGVRVINVPADDQGRVDLRRLMEILGREGIDSLLLEGGAELNWSMLKAGLVHRVQAYIAPKILGGKGAPSPVGGTGAPDPDSGIFLKNSVIRKIGDDFMIESEVDTDVHGTD